MRGDAPNARAHQIYRAWFAVKGHNAGIGQRWLGALHQPQQWRAAQVVSAADVMPLYVRDEVAQTMAQRGVAS